MTFEKEMRIRVLPLDNVFGNKWFSGKSGTVTRVFKMVDLVDKKWVSPHRTVEVHFDSPIRVSERVSQSVWRFSPENLEVLNI